MKKTTLFSIMGTLVFAATAALATQVIQRTPQELAQESALIVEGTVTGVRSYWNDDHSKIFTEATVAVGSTYKGRGGSTIRVVQPGGVVGNVRMTAHGALAWSRGEDVLLMLEPAFPGTFQIAGFSQGKYAIERDARTGKAFVQQALPPDVEGAGTPATNNAASKERVTIEQFINQVLPQN
ncbi:MAG TPA: hypothetical protein VFX92_12560 [Candidatus Krumholzibacteria bacterium]|nr:hypothetical protein [Candidatus Krumholzibacteria bacterium]